MTWLLHPWKTLKFKVWAWAAEVSLVFIDLPEIGFDDEDE